MCHWAELNRNGVIANAEDNSILYSVVLRDKAFLLWSKAVARFVREGDKVSRVILDRFFTCLAERQVTQLQPPPNAVPRRTKVENHSGNVRKRSYKS